SPHTYSRRRSGSFDFFFSSRRRHTRWPRDWSSDVCSSDLMTANASGCFAAIDFAMKQPDALAVVTALDELMRDVYWKQKDLPVKIGRASCRERVEISVVGG